MNADDFFCKNCKRIKSKCICHKKTVVERNMEIYMKYCRDETLKPIFEANYEVVDFREIKGKTIKTVSVDLIDINTSLKNALRERGIEDLYEFQAKAINLIKQGRDVIITAPTGMGKTEAFALPLIERVLDRGKGIVVYPTKALARDQLEKIRYYAKSCGLEVVKFDGDSDATERSIVFRGKADIILTNPDMIDYHLRNSPRFRDIISDLSIMVFDELHSYSGFLGSNIYWLMRRIERFCTPQIVACTATIDNPKEFGKLLFERKFEIVKFDEKRTSHRLMMIYGNIFDVIRDIVSKMKDKKILIFGNSYGFVESVAWMLERNGVKSLVHKAGLPKNIREKAEKMFKDGNINVLVSTSTLELGIDIGDVDCVISELVPYPIFLQRAGRAGRKGNSGLGIILLKDESAIGEYYRKNPDEYYREKMLCYAEKENEVVAEYHVHSMALEMPIQKGEVDENVIKRLVNEGWLIDAGDFYIAGRVRKEINMRGVGKRVKIIHNGKVIGERTLPIAIKELYPGAVFLHNRKKYTVKSLDLKNMTVMVEEIDASYTTLPIYVAIPRITEVVDSLKNPVNAIYCQMDMTLMINGYGIKSILDGKLKGTEYFNKPISYSFKTKGFVFSCPYPDKMDYDEFFAGSFHAVEHALIETSDAITGGGSNMTGGISTPDGFIFVYDSIEGGSGISKLLFSRLKRAFQISLSVLERCECNRIDGCPKCTYSYQCGNNNRPLNRIGAINAIRKILNGVKRESDFSLFEEVRDFVYYP